MLPSCPGAELSRAFCQRLRVWDVCVRRARRLDGVCFSCSMCKGKVLRVLVTLCIKAPAAFGPSCAHQSLPFAPEERA